MLIQLTFYTIFGFLLSVKSEYFVKITVFIVLGPRLLP